jgi:hypothetical protein
LIITPLWAVGYQIATRSGAAKELHVHARGIAPIGQVIAGWFGIDHAPNWVHIGILGVVGLGAVALCVRTGPTHRRLFGAALLGYAAVHIATFEFFDAAFAFDSERTLLFVRVLVFLILADLGFAAVRRLQWARIMVPALAAIVIVLWLSVGDQSAFEAQLAPRLTRAQRQAVDPRGLPLLSNFADNLYVDLRRPVVGLPAQIEDSTGLPRDVRRETADLVRVLRSRAPKFLAVSGQNFVFQPVRADQWPRCTRIRSLPAVAGMERYVVDIRRCRAT